MLRTLFNGLILSLLITASGCAICCSPDDEAYSAYGGRWERTDMYHGRVGSAFAPAGHPTTFQEPTFADETSDDGKMVFEGAPQAGQFDWSEDAYDPDI